MNYRLLTLEEKIFVLDRLRELDHLDHLIPPNADMYTVYRRMQKKKVVGAFDEEGRLHYVYWTYGQDDEAKRRFIAVGALRPFDREMLCTMRHVVAYLTREWELWGEIDADNPRGVKLGELCGFTVEAVLGSRIIVKHERSTKWEAEKAEITTSRM